eukprot:1147439-Pelagomonas_calceolata.AAC.11
MASLKINSSPGSLLQRQKRSLPPSRVLHAPHRRRQCTAAALPDSDANNIYFVYGGLGLAGMQTMDGGAQFCAPQQACSGKCKRSTCKHMLAKQRRSYHPRHKCNLYALLLCPQKQGQHMPPQCIIPAPSHPQPLALLALSS